LSSFSQRLVVEEHLLAFLIIFQIGDDSLMASVEIGTEVLRYFARIAASYNCSHHTPSCRCRPFSGERSGLSLLLGRVSQRAHENQGEIYPFTYQIELFDVLVQSLNSWET